MNEESLAFRPAEDVSPSQLPAKTPSLIASTLNTYSCSIIDSLLRERKLQILQSLQSPPETVPNPVHKPSITTGHIDDPSNEVNYFKSAQWTPDGTSLITSSADNTIRTFVLPPSLLTSPTPTSLTPYTTHLYPSPLNTLLPYPLYDLSSPSTTLLLTAPTALPIRLTNTLSPSPTPISTYTFISPTTEAYYTPASLLFTTPTTFLAGTDCLIGLFDLTRNGSGPLLSFPTIPSKRHKMKGGGVGMRGIVSALALQPEEGGKGIVAAGTWTRWVGLYDSAGMGGTVATWSIASAADDHAGIGGSGITQTAWSRCGRYLYVVERKTRGVLVFDVRVTGKLVGWLEGREAMTNQRLGIDVFEGEKGMEIWGGGTDGVVKVWEGVGSGEGAMERSWEWKAHDDPVSSTVVHSTGTVVATCSGKRAEIGVDAMSDDGSDTDSSDDSSEDSSDESSSDDESISTDSSTSESSIRPLSRTPDNSIKVWSL